MSTAGEIKCLVVSEHVVMFKEQPAVVGGDKWARRRTVGPEGSKGSGPDLGATGGCGRERGSCFKEDSQESRHSAPYAFVGLVPAFLELSL